MKDRLSTDLFQQTQKTGYSPLINDQIYQTIKVQLIALNLVKVDFLQSQAGGMALYWSLTEEGYELMMSSRTIKKKVPAINLRDLLER